LGYYPVINAALNVGLTWDYLTYYSTGYLKPGDIVLLPLEATYFQSPEILSDKTVIIAHIKGLDYFRSLSLSDKILYFRLIDRKFIRAFCAKVDTGFA